MESLFQPSDLLGSVYKNGNVQFFDAGLLASPIGNRVKIIDLKNDSSHTLQCESNHNIVHIAFNHNQTMAVLINEMSIASLVLLEHNIVVYQRKMGRNVRCAAFSPNNQYLAFGMDGCCAVYQVDTAGVAAEPLRMLTRRRFGNLAADGAITTVQWAADSRALAVGSRSHAVRIFPAIAREHRFPLQTIADNAEAVGCFFNRKDSYDVRSLFHPFIALLRVQVLIINRRGKLTHFVASVPPARLWKKADGEMEVDEADRQHLRYSLDRGYTKILYEMFEGNGRPDVSAASFSRKDHLLAVGFENSAVLVLNVEFEPVVLKHLNLDANRRVETIDLTAGHLAFAVGRGFNASLFVWDLKSEVFVVKQQSHTKPILCAAYSPLGIHLATGGEDHLVRSLYLLSFFQLTLVDLQVKIWNAQSCMCVVTLSGHKAPVTSLSFTESGNAVLSALMDGQVMAHDMKRYRHFRTMSAPQQTQLDHLCADRTGQQCMAASRQSFEIFVWAIENGNLLDVMHGHTAPITGMSLHGLRLASVSMDKTMRIWNVARAESERVQLSHEGVCVKHSPDGFFLAALTLDSTVHVFEAATHAEVFLLETRLDMDVVRERGQQLKKETVQKNKSYTCLEFSPTGSLLLVGGQSSMFSIYDFANRVILRRLRLSQNMSIEGTNPRFTPFVHGEEQTDSEGEDAIRAPGVARKDPSERVHRPSMELRQFSFNPIGRSFAAVTTEGVQIFAVDNHRRFQSRRLAENVTPAAVEDALHEEEFGRALCMSLALNDDPLLERTLNEVPVKESGFLPFIPPFTPRRSVSAFIGDLRDAEAGELLRWLAANVARVGRVRIGRFFALTRELLFAFGHVFKAQLVFADAITALQQFFRKQQELLDLMKTNQGLVDYICAVRELNGLKLESAA
ncbi:Periodic tryptophan protein 2-like protein [Aphelenchoides fujianensis]|nr:Periodic tryptophan protein 2-like protein [Aphelenchoides fujianensis]